MEAATMIGYRVCWGKKHTAILNYNVPEIDHRSYVIVTASEGSEKEQDGKPVLDSQSPHRFVGDARITVDNISPHDGGVTFRVTVDWPDPLMLWTDIIIVDDIQYAYQGPA